MELIFLLPTVIFLVSGLPQTLKLLKTKRACHISRLTYLLTATAIAIIIVDAARNEVWTIVLSSGVSLITVLTNLFLITKYQNAENSRIGNT